MTNIEKVFLFVDKNKKKFVVFSLSFLVLLYALVIFAVIRDNKNYASESAEKPLESEAIQIGKILSHDQCSGEGVPYKLSASPMKPDDFTIVVPYGLMVGSHVTPIDHQYFTPKDYNSEVDAYEVMAMADSNIVEITERSRSFGQEYRMVFSVSCTFFYYYDLVTSLNPEIKEAYDESKNEGSALNIPVKAGEVIGRIGGQTLDFAVWDTTKKLDGFLIPEHYSYEAWKIHTVDPLEYYDDDLKSFIMTRYARTDEPISGKIDYDIDGRLSGSWFLEGSDGYSGDKSDNGMHYWNAHLSFSPDLYEPSWFIVSIGDWNGKGSPGEQFIAVDNSPNPKDVSMDSGLVKYNLNKWSYLKEGGAVWDQMSVPESIDISLNNEPIKGCALVQMIEDRKIKFEVFKNTDCSTVDGFTDEAKVYLR